MAIATLSSLAQTTDVQRLSLTIKTMSPTPFGFDVSVEVKNSSGKPVLLQLSPELAGNPRLQALTVQQWDEKLGWQYVGPCRDLEGDTARTLVPHQVVEDTVPISDSSLAAKYGRSCFARITPKLNSRSATVAPDAIR